MTKKILKIIFLLLFAKNSFCQKLEIIRDTINIYINGRIGPGIVYNDNFYCFFKKDNNNFAYDSEILLVFNRKGEVLKKIIAPANIRIYYDLFVKNDSVFVLDYYDHDTYFVNENFDFIKIKRVDDLIYQDSSYYVTSINHGEFGGTSWFINKQTKQEFEISLSNPIINKFHNNYILTYGKCLFEINNPTDLKQCFAPRDYNTSFQTDTILYTTNCLQGVHKIYADSDSLWNSKFYIATSTIINDKLYHLCVDSNICYLANLEAGKLKPVFIFEKGLFPFRSFFQDRNRIIDNNYQSIQFTTSDDQLNGILEFKDNRIILTYFHNLYKTAIWDKESSKQHLISFFDYYFKKYDSINICYIDSLETTLKAEDILPGGFSVGSIKEYQTLEPRIYRKIEDSCLQLITIYGYTSVSKTVETINFEWKEHFLFDKGSSSFFNEESKGKALLTEKMDWLIAEFSNRFGKAEKDIQGKNFREINWEMATFRIILHGIFTISPKYYNLVELDFYKK